jgi:molybdenum cofactor biosynthesis enzyme MoaA
MMDEATADLIHTVLAALGLQALDLTGGAPELHRRFRALVRAARRLGVKQPDYPDRSGLRRPSRIPG